MDYTLKRFLSRVFILIFLFTLFNVQCFSVTTPLPPIIPQPQKITLSQDFLTLKDKLSIIIKGKAPETNKFAAEQIQSSLNDFLTIKSEVVLDQNSSGDIVLNQLETYTGNTTNDIPKEKTQESYCLKISKNGIEIQAVSSKGIFYGVMSLIQILEKTENKKLAAMEIIDWPDLEMRGISDDISRGQVSTLENFKRIIQFMARYKMNTYMPYLEDMLQFDHYPSIGKGRGALSKDEVRELVSFAKKYFIDVVPIFETLGHFENILSQEEFLNYADFPGAACLDVSNDSTYVLLETMLKEIFEIFPSPYFHMGADESWDVGLGKSKFLVDQSSLAKVHAIHYKKVYDICKKNNKTVLMYGDIILNNPDIIKEIPKDIIIVDWFYGDQYKYPSTDVFKKAGLKYYVSPSVWNFKSSFPINLIAFPNIEYFTKEGLKNGASGMINSNWGDYGAETFKELVLYGYAWSAQCAWSGKYSHAGTFSENYFYDFFGINDSRLPGIYETLSSSFNQLMWHDIWYHPALPIRKSQWWLYQMTPVAKKSWMDRTLPSTLKDIELLEKSVKKNKDHFDLLKFIIKLDNWFEIKQQAQLMLQDKLDNIVIDEKILVQLIDDNITSLESLKTQYSLLWLKYYKKDNLNMIQDKFDRLIRYFQETKQSLAAGKLVSPVLTSKWIYCKNPDSTFAKSARFKKDFDLAEKPINAQLQFMGDTYAKLYINGVYVNQVYERRHLSLLTEYQRIKLFDITKYLHEGPNSIVAEVKNYDSKGSAGLNIISRIQGNNSVTVIETDETWKTSPSVTVSKPYPQIIVAPDFETGRPSWIERAP